MLDMAAVAAFCISCCWWLWMLGLVRFERAFWWAARRVMRLRRVENHRMVLYEVWRHFISPGHHS